MCSVMQYICRDSNRHNLTCLKHCKPASHRGLTATKFLRIEVIHTLVWTPWEGCKVLTFNPWVSRHLKCGEFNFADDKPTIEERAVEDA
ncbi:hypothetical protein CORC01_11984 [Colletotrichum orchidophilum]|uniref:Uncharacterized protein n=1 Tax=Colletotrichum orchidophilum TaxID=1209926 RepID=A0A1G4AUE2_9PEZI|nr:uncharacterized protein CORC01_11984 [Colletotrichum orchidophilum]OHE92703.1 hypothetical protein CORC01_11984 [Colletotrichum orchidophilum]